MSGQLAWICRKCREEQDKEDKAVFSAVVGYRDFF